EHRRFRLIDTDAVEPPPGQVQVRVGSVGICGSDLHYFSEGAIGDIGFQYPVVLGHEPTGAIWKMGAGVSGYSRGDRVFLEPALYCYHCEFCRSGRHNLCENICFLSTPPDPGFFREFVNLPVSNVLPIPEGIPSDVGTLFEPLAVVLHSMKLAAMQLGETAVVFGGGPIGLMTVACLRAAGAGRIWCVEPRADRRELASLMGATEVIDPSQVNAVSEILAGTNKRGVDAGFDCATKDRTVQDTVNACRNGGRAIVTGIPSERETPLNLHVLRRKELVLFNVRRSNHETDAAIEMLAAKPELFAPLVTHRMPIDKIDSAFQMLEAGGDGAAKVVLQFPKL
ncbi:MAG TPA: alcohol dehydrogenase catalytic domain-containing protein, partial [Bryobacteraceae bacterium]|nr:alcohol dehydrogenase catalytic domain-containing protein [Bryobacteraceae bacterium]